MKNKIIELLSLISSAYPKLRIGQIMVNAATKGGWNQSDIFYCPNEIVLKGLQTIYDEIDNGSASK